MLTVFLTVDASVQKMLEEMIQVYGNMMMARKSLCWKNCRTGLQP